MFKLISCVEKYVEIWKAEEELYRNQNTKEAAWRSISENDFNDKINSNDLSNKWSSMRVQYNQIQSKQKNMPSGWGANKSTKWK